MKKLHTAKRWLRMSAFASIFSCFFTVPLSAQTFNPPGAFEDTYPIAPAIGLTDHTSAYSVANVNIPGIGSGDLVLAGWDHANPGQPAGVSWRLITPGTFGVIAQGVIPYANVRDLEVGWLDAGGDPQILVAYYRNGVGHMLDVYSLFTGTPVLLYTNTLSLMTNYTRISMDCHIPPYAVGIIWEDASGGLSTVCGLTAGGFGGITYSNILSIIGTNGETVPDLAFNHTNGLWLQCVSYNPTSGNFTEFMFDFWTAMGSMGTTIPPIVNDINFVGICTSGGTGNPDDPHPVPGARGCPYPNIDAPGHGNQSWAYTYTLNNADISVRLFDQFSATLATTIVNNGSIGNWPINGNTNTHPFPYYNWIGCGSPGGIVVAWHTNTIDINGTGATAGYVGLQMNVTGTALVSAPDYLTVGVNPTWASPTPVLSISKSDDMMQYMYTVFPERDPWGVFQMENKYPALCFGSFKGEAQPDNHVVCNDDEKRAAFLNSAKARTTINVYPNPTDASFSLSIPAAYQLDEMTVIVTNILGVVAGKYNGPAAQVNAYLNELGKDLRTGTYLVDVTVPGKIKETMKVVKVQ